jgi:hypothetical protein
VNQPISEWAATFEPAKTVRCLTCCNARVAEDIREVLRVLAAGSLKLTTVGIYNELRRRHPDWTASISSLRYHIVRHETELHAEATRLDR